MDKILTAIQLTVKDAETLLQYLAAKPYAEVAQLIDMIQKTEKIFTEQE